MKKYNGSIKSSVPLNGSISICPNSFTSGGRGYDGGPGDNGYSGSPGLRGTKGTPGEPGRPGITGWRLVLVQEYFQEIKEKEATK